ncbi:MAG: 6-phosphogluconolactonase [Proteobacteria bacterium]|nr:6-phosphogluconolactonase [Pseudomonadota bacterium]
MSAMKLHRYSDTSRMCDALASLLADVCATSTAPSLALAGGKTPLPIYRALAQRWSQRGQRARIVPTDDRCVADTHPASNIAALRAAFGNSADCLAITAVDGETGASLAVAKDVLGGIDIFDAVLLGMGEDGHFASLFPGATNLQDGLAPDARDDAILTTPVPLPPEAPFSRISLTLPRLLRTRSAHLCITGVRKLEVLEQAVSQTTDLPYPVAALLRQTSVAVNVHWSP